MSEWCERFHESQESNEDDLTDGLQKSVTMSEAMKCQTGDFETTKWGKCVSVAEDKVKK